MSDNINIKYEYVPRFKAGDPESVSYLEEHGYVVFREVLAEPEVRKARPACGTRMPMGTIV